MTLDNENIDTGPVGLSPSELRGLADALRPYLQTEPAALLTPREAAQRAGVHVETVRRAVRSGALPASHAGRVVRIEPGDLDAWLGGTQQPYRARTRRRRSSAPRGPLADALTGEPQPSAGIGWLPMQRDSATVMPRGPRSTGRNQ